MPRLNTRGQALMGRGSGPCSVDGRLVITPGGGPASWRDDAYGVVNTNARTGQWETCAVLIADGTLLGVGPTANDLAGGGGRWLGWNPVDGLFGNLFGLPRAGGVRGAGLDGTLAYCPDRQSGRGLVLLAPDGTSREVPGASVYDEYSLQVLGPGRAVWYDGAQVQTLGLDYALRFATPPGKCRVVELSGGLEVLVYWAPALDALVAQENGFADGWVLQPGPFAFNHDALAVDGEVVVAWSVTQGEAPGDLRKVTLDRSQPRIPLVPQQAPVPIFHFTHPVLLAPFKAGASGLPDAEHDLGIYTEAPDPCGFVGGAEVAGQRLLVGHDALADWTLPACLRPWDIPLLEYYRVPEETLAQSVARWTRQTDQLLAQWPGTCGVIPMCYTQFRWTPAEVCDGLAALSALVNRSPRLALIAPFAYDRANGVTGVRELWAPFDALLAASRAAGLAGLPPVGGSPPPPPPPRKDPMPPVKSKDHVRADITELIRFYMDPDGLNRRARGIPEPVVFHDPAITDWFTLAVIEDVEQVKARIRTFPEWKEQHPGDSPNPL